MDALALMRAGKLREALVPARRAVEGAATCRSSHALLALILARLGETTEAEAVITLARDLREGAADAYAGLAFAAFEMARHELANGLYHRAAAAAPHEARHHYDLATSERSFGRLQAAERCCDRAIACDPLHYTSHLLRSELAVQTPERNHVSELASLATRMAADERAVMFLGYALGKELDDLGRFDEAFAWFARAAACRRRHLSYDVEADLAKLRRIEACFAEPVSASRPRRPGHVFIIGLPRSGTTLLERILSALPGTRSNGETDHFSRALLAGSSAEGGDVFARAAGADWTQVGQGYALSARAASNLTVIEKLPLNTLYAGAIRRALPDAVLVHVTRSPVDVGFAMFRTLFASAYPFSYRLDELARYMAGHAALMRHWRATLGDALLEVAYEDLVRDPETIAREVAAACGLEWRPEAVALERQGGVSLTASAAQIRRPIYGTSSGKWRNYRQHLQPFVADLRARGLAVPEDADFRKQGQGAALDPLGPQAPDPSSIN